MKPSIDKHDYHHMLEVSRYVSMPILHHLCSSSRKRLVQQKLPNDLFSYMRLAHTCDEAGAREAAAFQDSVMGTHAELTAVEHLTDHLQQRLARCAQPACPPHSMTLDIDCSVAGWLRATCSGDSCVFQRAGQPPCCTLGH